MMKPSPLKPGQNFLIQAAMPDQLQLFDLEAQNEELPHAGDH